MPKRISLLTLQSIFWKQGACFYVKRVDPNGMEDLKILEFRNETGFLLYDLRTQTIVRLNNAVWKWMIEEEENESKIRRPSGNA